MILIVVVLLFQMKLLNKVDEITAHFSTMDDQSTANSLLPPPAESRKDVTVTKGQDRQTNRQKYPNCPFKDSSLVESIYVYPIPNSPDFTGDILSTHAQTNNSIIEEYPWVAIDAKARADASGPYDTTSQLVQYNTELMVRDVITHPESCLRTDDPETATLFYVPYLPSAEFHAGKLHPGDYSTSKYGQAIMDILLENNYEGWETVFGLTSQYWKRRHGADHILVFSEPMHGTWHPRSKRGNFHFIHSQFQLKPPIVVSVELSTTFVDMYPACARTNILMPYPNTDGRWFNGALNQEASDNLVSMGIHAVADSPAALATEIELAKKNHPPRNNNATDWSHQTPPRAMAQYYKAGFHGTCRYLRQSMASDYKCTPSGKFSKLHKISDYAHGYRQSTFCPCPGGDSPSAKRMFDALLAGCIPVILSHDFVWPFSAEFDRSASRGGGMGNAHTAIVDGIRSSVSLYGDLFQQGQSSSSIALLNPADFSIRLNVKDHMEPKFSPRSCERVTDGKGANQTDLQSVLDAIPPEEMERLKRGAELAGYAYSYYQKRPDLPDNPMTEGILPDGGAAHMLVRALEERALGRLWPACEQELRGKDPSKDNVNKFKC
jgi:hypothetical protein